MKTRAAFVPIAILFCCCFSPLLQSSRVLVCSVPPGSLTLLRYLFVFCTASLQPQTSPSPPTPCSSSFFFFFFYFCPRRVLHLTLSPSRSVYLVRAPGPAFLSPSNCSNFDPRDTARPVGMWTLHMCASVSHTRIAKHELNMLDIGPYCISTIG